MVSLLHKGTTEVSGGGCDREPVKLSPGFAPWFFCSLVLLQTDGIHGLPEAWVSAFMAAHPQVRQPEAESAGTHLPTPSHTRAEGHLARHWPFCLMKFTSPIVSEAWWPTRSENKKTALGIEPSSPPQCLLSTYGGWGLVFTVKDTRKTL